MELLIKSIPLLMHGAIATLHIAFVAILFGFCGGVLIGVLNCNKMGFTYLRKVLSTLIWVVRGTPLFVQVLIAYYAVPEALGFSLSPFTAGVIALGINSSAYISEIVRGGINAIPDGQWEAAHVLGLGSVLTLKGIILPQVLSMTMPSLTNELTALIKETSILMVIGVAELTKVSKDIVARELDPMTIYLASGAIYLVLTSSLAFLGQLAEKRGTS